MPVIIVLVLVWKTLIYFKVVIYVSNNTIN